MKTRKLFQSCVLIYWISLCDAGYGAGPGYGQEAQSDVQAPAYVPPYLRHQQFSKTSYSSGGYGGTKTGYAGTKTGYTGTKTYSGTKTGYSGTKTVYSGTKTGYSGTKTGYSGTKTVISGSKIGGGGGGYSEKRTWYSNSGSIPGFGDFQGSANQPYQAQCQPECKNAGICVDTNTCVCGPNFHGKFCEFEKKPCLTYPPMPQNAAMKCFSETCTITCADGHKFPDGSSIANMRCVEGQWQPTRADLTSIPDCDPECSPPCLNGGVCLSMNTCQCPMDYRGPQCQYSATACDFRKISFNGAYNCTGDSDKYTCKLSCPVGSSYSTPSAGEYTCLYSTGQFQPQPIPHCVFEEIIVITPSNYRFNQSYFEYQSSNQSMEGGEFYKTHYFTNEGGINQQGINQEGINQQDIKQQGIKQQGMNQLGVHQHGMNQHGYSQHGSGNPVIIVQDITPKPGSCFTWAGVHYKSFDGKIYSFESPCQHILLRDAKDHDYTIAIKQGDCIKKSYCPSELTIYLDDKPFILSVGEDGSVLFRNSRRLIPIPAALPGLRVTMPASDVLVQLDSQGVNIRWDTNNLVLIEVNAQAWNKTEGLCGSLDGNPENDFTTKDGNKANTKSVMASSWQINKIGDVCDSTPSESNACASKSSEDMRKAKQFCQTIFSKQKFRKCSEVMDVSLLLEACQWDYCACSASQSPEDCACSTVAVYAKECLRRGLQEMKNWRDDETCPMRCTGGMLYQSCGPESQPSCSFPSPPAADNSSCVEGCFCPPGLLLEAGKCIEKANCPCRLRNKNFKPGSVVNKDCNTCSCSGGSWSCSQVSCGGRCSAVGDPHYTTFDGLRFDFMGHCTYTLMQANNITVNVENVACSGAISEAMNLSPYKGEGKPSCTKAVNLEYNGASIHMKQGGFILVNGKEVTSLPVIVGDVKIRAASSLFVIVQLPNKVDLWWDGNTRVFIDVPPAFRGKTKGLCGTFNAEQKDDFLTPEGDVEQTAAAFANKWKTREFCQDADVVEPEHPCKANVENKEAAEKYCSKLKSKLFEPCHWHVDVEPYYEACVYDMCACAGDLSRCLCPILGDYAMTCAKTGVKVQWRYNVKECELECPGGQEYTVCADSCQRTCADLAMSAQTCRPVCVEGCACPAGQVLDKNNVCVPVGLCPCYHKGLQFDSGYKEVRPGRRERELCTCVGAQWDCSPASPADIQNYPPAEDIRNNCSASKHMEFTTCQLATPLTCKNMHLPPSPTSLECRPGCQCKVGFVLDVNSNKCVPPDQCPCHHGGQSYVDGHKMVEDCNTCECKMGNWSCTEKQCAGVCTSWGDSHVSTFDGTQYDFEGVCTYLLSKGVMDGKDGFMVEIQNVPCGTTGATCSKSLTLKVGSGNEEEIVSLTKNQPLPDTSKLKRIKQRQAGAFVFLDVPSLGMSVQWDKGVRVYVRVDSMWRGRVKGLCGNFNGDIRDDFQTPSGGGIAESSPLIFADSWKLKPTCPKSQMPIDHCKQRPERKDWSVSACSVMKRYPFTLCHSEVPATPYIDRCEKDACACDSGADCECACSALAAYAHACTLRGVSFKWRTQDLCPMQCDEECSNYDACVSPCPLETCENTLYYNDIKAMCEKETCVEGCKPKKSCPEGSVYTNSTFTECVTRNKCRPVCMTLQDGRQVLEGEVIEEDSCHTCRCSKKQKICTGQPCSTEPAGREYFPTSPRPLDEPLKCVPGWTSWINTGPPDTQADGESIDKEPLPKAKDLKIGSPMCSVDKMTKIECRTVGTHKTPKETGLDVECSLERGLVCREREKECADFEIKVFCDCGEEPFQCLNSTVPNHPHPSDCSKFYECTPSVGASDQPHAVLKTCSPGLMYNPDSMVCDWPDAVKKIRPECGSPIIVDTTLKTTTETTSRADTIPTTKPTTPESTTQQTTASLCGPGKVHVKCAYACDKLCDHFKKTLVEIGKCLPGEKCADACIDESVANTKCEFGSLWRDYKTCVPIKDCTCYFNGNIVKPKGVVNEGCAKCQCLDNALHCDYTDCVSIKVPFQGSTHLPLLRPEEFLTAETLIYNTTTVPSSTSTTPIVTKIVPTVAATAATTTTAATSTTVTTPTTASTSTTVTTPTTVNAPLILTSTVSPPPECSPDRYKGLLWEDEFIPETSFSASSVANALFAPQYAVFNGHSLDITAGSWNPKVQDNNQWIQVELPQREPVYGVKLQGSPLFDQYVTSYEVMYGDDGQVFSKIPQIFRGPTDHNNGMKQMFATPVEAEFIRLRPLTWHDDIALRWELIGCSPFTSTTRTSTTPERLATTITTPAPIQCDEPIGLNAELPIENIEVSSNNDLRRHLKLSGDKAWKPIYSTPGEWVMFDFTAPRNITGVKTKGGPLGFVSKYSILYTSDLSTFSTLGDLPGNFDKNTEVFNEFKPPIRARYLKVVPLKWKDAINMRIEPIGCFEPYPVTQYIPPEYVPTTGEPCSLCPGVESSTCNCVPPLKYYDGESCVSRDQCPCVEGFMTYAVGSAFRGDKCDECVCKLGGVTICKPAKECACAPELVPKLTSSCECACTPCANGTRICPTSNICVSLDKWCDGVRDCPDDELDCTTTVATTTTPVTVTKEPEVVTTVGPTVGYTQPRLIATTVPPKLQECPVVSCPPGYIVSYTSTSPRTYYTNDLPPPRPRYSYRRYQKGGYTKGGYTKGGFSKTGYSKGGYSKGGFGQQSQAFALAKPTVPPSSPASPLQPCIQFKCIANFPPPRPGSTSAPVICSAPMCPPTYTLKMEATVNGCPQYSCTPPPERRAFCELTGRTFNTFDGTEYKYDVCFHILARDNTNDAWTVLVRKKCRLEGCFNELIVQQDDQVILVKSNLMIEYDNYEYTVEQTSKICFQKNSFDVSRLGDGLSIKSRKYNFTVLYSKDGDVKVGVSKSLLGTVDGLCGSFDGNPKNDRSLPSGRLATSIDEFGRSWAKPGLPANACKTKVINAEKQKRAWELCDVITKEPLSECGAVLNLEKWRHICLEKICECTEQLINGTKRTEEECRCLLVEQMVGECLAESDLDIAGWRLQLDCPAACPAPLIHQSCYRRGCEPACAGAGSPRCTAEPGHCFPGCYCPEGTLRKGNDCIPPTECLDCTCVGLGSPAKYQTFEGDDLPFLGNCTYLASRDKNETGIHKYEVYATNGPCEGKPLLVCTEAVHIIYEKNIIHITRDDANKKLQTTIDNVVVYKYPLKKDWVTVTQSHEQDVHVVLNDIYTEIKVQYSKMSYTILVPSYLYANRTEGLCGVCAGTQQHLTTSNGTITDDIDEYGKSWQASPATLQTLDIDQQQCLPPPEEEPCTPPENSHCNLLYNGDKFGQCHALVDPRPFVESCKQDLCNNVTDVCNTLQQYAAECMRQHVCLDWRDEKCPMKCEAPFVYRPCVACEPSCDNQQTQNSACNKDPIEGCFCPQGKARVNNTCIEPSKCFPCDSNNEHYAGDQWQEDACTTCFCSKSLADNSAHISCKKESCSTPLCDDEQDLITTPAKPGKCCPTYLCVPKPTENIQCDEPKPMECAFGQVLKLKTKQNGCKEFACECKPANECEPIPSESEVDIFEPGMVRVIDHSGCCARAHMMCDKDKCPREKECPDLYEVTVNNDTGKCCPVYNCELPKDKCLVTLEWEAVPTGGEKLRTTTQTVLKDIDAVWQDGPCRSCRCSAPAPDSAPAPAPAPAPQCSVAECPALDASDHFLMEPQPAPYQCCLTTKQVACKANGTIYKPGQNWTSSEDPCKSYRCVEGEDGVLEKVVTLKTCDTACQPGSQYFPSTSEVECCGKCKPVACIINGIELKVGEKWRSEDFCLNYTCVDVDGSLQVQSANESCPTIPAAVRKQFVLEETTVSGQCCKVPRPVACRVGRKIYQEGQTWPSSDPCKNISCSRDVTGTLTQTESFETCNTDCKKGWKYEPPVQGCCGKCVQEKCVVGDELKAPGSTWYSEDNCTTFSCVQVDDDIMVTSSRQQCSDVSSCPQEYLKPTKDGCCQVCDEPPAALSTCVPEAIRPSIGVVRVKLGSHGLCINKHELKGFNECTGHCSSHTLYNNQTGSHESKCECCTATKYSPLTVQLSCEDGSTQQHRVATPRTCACAACGSLPGDKSSSGVKTSGVKTTSGTQAARVTRDEHEFDYDIPEIFQRMGH